MRYVFFLMLVTLVVLAAMVVDMVHTAGLTLGQIIQRRVENVSSPPHIDEDEYKARVMAVVEDIPNSQLVRVVVKRDDGMVLGVLSTKHTQLTVGQTVLLASAEYKQTEFHITGIFYIKE
ncbi:MAG TPA: hypothetical protein VI489_00375 [Candidatus Brocadiaceae bacterium]